MPGASSPPPSLMPTGRYSPPTVPRPWACHTGHGVVVGGPGASMAPAQHPAPKELATKPMSPTLATAPPPPSVPVVFAPPSPTPDSELPSPTPTTEPATGYPCRNGIIDLLPPGVGLDADFIRVNDDDNDGVIASPPSIGPLPVDFVSPVLLAELNRIHAPKPLRYTMAARRGALPYPWDKATPETAGSAGSAPNRLWRMEAEAANRCSSLRHGAWCPGDVGSSTRSSGAPA
ncbi:hypothetical protein ACP4OV_020384 [Aristida adscensionis]